MNINKKLVGFPPKSTADRQFPSPAFKNHLKRFILVFIVFGIIGCAAAPIVPPPQIPQISRGVGIYHRVMPGETLWRISRLYNVDLEEVVRINRIPDAAIIEKGQMIFIPGATTPKKEDQTTASSKESNFSWPIKGKIISHYGTVQDNRLNKGIEMQVRAADNIFASADGRVTFLDELKGYGKTIIVEHINGITTVYSGSLREQVNLDDWVNGGSVIARIAGTTNGSVSVFHFEVRRGFKSQNPLYYLP